MKAMNESRRQRLVGALVLLALGTVILPILFDFKGAYHVDTRTTIPPAPDIQAIEIEKAGPVPGATAAASHEEMFRYDDSREKAVESDSDESNVQYQPPGLNAEGIPLAWIVQVASFSDTEKAQALTEQLLADGYKAYRRRAVVKGDVDYRIYVGPKVSKDSMLAEKRAIEEKYKLKALLLTFEP